MRRYTNTTVLRNGRQLGTTNVGAAIRSAISRGVIRVDIYIAKEGERLDSLAGKNYGDARLWWVIAGASGVGWGLQVPPGTRLQIPRKIEEVASVVG